MKTTGSTGGFIILRREQHIIRLNNLYLVRVL